MNSPCNEVFPEQTIRREIDYLPILEIVISFDMNRLKGPFQSDKACFLGIKDGTNCLINVTLGILILVYVLDVDNQPFPMAGRRNRYLSDGPVSRLEGPQDVRVL
jgi:hypothetical protein